MRLIKTPMIGMLKIKSIIPESVMVKEWRSQVSFGSERVLCKFIDFSDLFYFYFINLDVL